MERTIEEIRTLISQIPGEVAAYKFDGSLHTVCYSDCVPQASAYTKEEYEELIIDNTDAIVLDIDHEYLADRIKKSLNGERNVHYYYRIKHKTKGYQWVHAVANMIGEMDGCPLLLAVFQNNLFEEESHNKLLGYSKEIVYVVEEGTYKLLYANDVAIDTWNSGNSFAGKPCYKFINDKEEPCGFCSIPLMKNGRSAEYGKYISDMDMYFDIECEKVDWYGRSAVAVLIMDVTASMKEKAELKVSNEAFETLITNIPGGIAVYERINGVDTCVAANPFYGEMIGIPYDKIVGETAEDAKARIHPDDLDEYIEVTGRLLEETEYVNCTYRIFNAEKRDYIWIRLQGRLKRNKNVEQAYFSYTDITAQKRIEADLNINQQRYGQAIKGANLNIWEYDPIKKIEISPRDFNDNYNVGENVYIIENVPESLCAHVVPEDKEKFMDMYRRIDKGETNLSTEVWHDFNPDGKLHCEHIFYTVVTDDLGKTVKAYGLGMDTTEQKLEQEKFRGFMELLRTKNEKTLGTFHLNLTKDTCIDYNSPYDTVRRLMGSDTVDLFFDRISDMMQDEEEIIDFKRIFNRTNIIKAFNRGSSYFEATYRLKRTNGEYQWVHGYLRVAQNPNTGELEGIAEAEDVNDEKVDEAIIQKVTTTKLDYIALIDVKNRTIEYRKITNNRCYEGERTKIPYDSENIRTIRALLPVDEQEDGIEKNTIEYIVSMLSKSEVYIYPYSQIDVDGQLLRKQMSYSWLDETHRMIIVIKNDITAIFKHDQEQMGRLRDALDAAKEADAAKTEFLSNVSHDMRTPLNGILGYANLALDTRDSNRVRNYLEKIDASGKILLQLINDTLNLSRIESSGFTLNMEAIAISELINRITDPVKPSMSRNKLNFIVTCANVGTRGLMVDISKVQEIFINLLSNSAKFTDDGGKINFDIECIDEDDNKADYRFIVKDTGCGISEDFLTKIFEPFAQEKLRGKENLEGTGLGLSIVKKLVEMMGGRISVKSRLGEGTETTIDLTFETTDDISDEKAPLFETPGSLKGRKVLICEDNEMNMEIARTILENAGIEVIQASNGEEGLEAFKASEENEIDLVLMDIRMPVMNGIEATKQIRKLNRADAAEIPVIAMTANAYDDDVRASKAAGMNAHLAKPVDVKKLFSAMAALISNK